MIGLIGGLFRAIYWRKPRNFAISNIIWMDIWGRERIEAGRMIFLTRQFHPFSFSGIIHSPLPSLVPQSAVCELWGGQMMVYENSFSSRGTMFVLWCWRHENLKLAGISEIKAAKLLKDKALLRFEDGEVFDTDRAALPSLANFKQEPSGTLIETINETHFKTTFNFQNFENHNITNYENWI